MRAAILVATSAVTLLAVAAVFLFVQLDRANAALRDTEASLADTQRDLRVAEGRRLYTEEALAGTTAALEQTEALRAETEAALLAERLARNELQAEANALREERDNLTVALEAETAKNVGLTRENVALTTNLAAVEVRARQLDNSLTAAEARERQLQNDVAAAAARERQLQSEKQTVEAELGQLQMAVGAVESLNARAQGLRTEIAELEERRRPLILQPWHTPTGGFACTGSMEPLITCLDTATWLVDYDPADIVVGTTISFDRQACWPDSVRDVNLAHRVLDVRVVNGVHEYWPKGDANREPDGCWVPHTAVDSYIIDLHKNTRPGNAALRGKVNAAKEAMRTLQLRHCGRPTWQGCSLSEPYYSQAITALERYRCWLDVARNAGYPPRITRAC